MFSKQVLVTGAGGFIGHHLVKYLAARGDWVRGGDVTAPEFEPTAAHEFELLDLRRWDNCLLATRGIDEVYMLAAGTGNAAAVVRDNALLGLHVIEAARLQGAGRLLFAPGGGEQPFVEQVCLRYGEDFGMAIRIVRLHGVYGPLGSSEGDNSPAAICRKIALADDGDAIEIFGESEPHGYCYIDDCVEGMHRLMRSDCAEPLDLAADRRVSIDELVDLVAAIAGKRILVRRIPTQPAPPGPAGDTARLCAALGWEPATRLEDGLAITYRWIAQRVAQRFHYV